jgi:hypothetical protein
LFFLADLTAWLANHKLYHVANLVGEYETPQLLLTSFAGMTANDIRTELGADMIKLVDAGKLRTALDSIAASTTGELALALALLPPCSLPLAP